jgi:hypothetical protein
VPPPSEPPPPGGLTASTWRTPSSRISRGYPYIYVPAPKVIHHLTFGGTSFSNMVIRAINFFLLLFISDLTLGFAAAHHPRVIVAANRKEDDVMATAQATATTAHREQEALITAVTATRKTMDEAWTCECAAALA